MQKTYLWWLLALWLGASFAVSGQSAGIKLYKSNYDSVYIKNYRHRMSVSFLTEFKTNTINVLSGENSNLHYNTNQPMPNYGMMFSYRWLNFSISVPIPGLSYTAPNRGETNSLSLGIGFTGRKWYLRNFYEKFEGYYLSNAESLYPNYFPTPDTIPLYPNMMTSTYLATAYYGLNGQKYSHRALMWQCEYQKKSAGSVLIGLNGGYQWISSPDAIYVSQDLAETIHAIQYYMAGVGVGYSYNFVIGEHVNISAMLVPGVNYLSGRFSTHQIPEKAFKAGWGITGEGRAQISYSTERFFMGVSYTGYLMSMIVNNITPVGSTHNYIKLNLGYRFEMKPVKFLRPFDLSN